MDELEFGMDVQVGHGIPLLRGPIPIRGDYRERWLELRRPGIGASDIAIVVGVSPYSSRFALWWQKREGWDSEMGESQEWGLRSEPMIAAKFAEEHPEWDLIIPAALYVHEFHPYVMCSPDRLVCTDDDQIQPVEIKTDEGGPGWGEPGTDEVPLHYKIQVQWQIEIFEAQQGRLIRYGGKRYSEYVIQAADPVVISYWIMQAAEFLQSIKDDNPPKPDGSKATTEALEALYPDASEKVPPALIPDDLAELWNELEEQKSDLTIELIEIKNRIRQLLGKAKYGINSQGETVVSRTVYPRRAYTVAESKVDRLNRGDGKQR